MPTETSRPHRSSPIEWTNGEQGYCSNSPPVYGWIKTGEPVYHYLNGVGEFHERVRTWNRLANYKARLEAGEILPTLPYSDFKLVRKYGQGGFVRQSACIATPTSFHAYSSGGGPMSQKSAALTTRQVSVDSDLMATAKLKALASAKDMSLNLPVLFAEATQTLGLIRSSLDRFGLFVLLLTEKKWRAAGRVLAGNQPFQKPSSKTLAGQILEYKYGWMPLASDMYGASKELCDLYGGKLPITSVTEYAYRDVSQAVGPEVVTPGLIRTNASGSTPTVEKTSGIPCTIKGELTKAQLATAGLRISPKFHTQPTSVGLQDPALLVWEKIPYSFVVDQVIDIASYLNAVTALRGLIVQAGFASHLTMQTAYSDALPVSIAPQDSFWCDRYTEHRRDYVREAWSGSLPDFTSLIRPLESLGISQILADASLLRQRINSRI